jgi:hypothetical protein
MQSSQQPGQQSPLSASLTDSNQGEKSEMLVVKTTTSSGLVGKRGETLFVTVFARRSQRLSVELHFTTGLDFVCYQGGPVD